RHWESLGATRRSQVLAATTVASAAAAHSAGPPAAEAAISGADDPAAVLEDKNLYIEYARVSTILIAPLIEMNYLVDEPGPAGGGAAAATLPRTRRGRGGSDGNGEKAAPEADGIELDALGDARGGTAASGADLM